MVLTTVTAATLHPAIQPKMRKNLQIRVKMALAFQLTLLHCAQVLAQVLHYMRPPSAPLAQPVQATRSQIYNPDIENMNMGTFHSLSRSAPMGRPQYLRQEQLLFLQHIFQMFAMEFAPVSIFETQFLRSTRCSHNLLTILLQSSTPIHRCRRIPKIRRQLRVTTHNQNQRSQPLV